jgi:hypothetical protein
MCLAQSLSTINVGQSIKVPYTIWISHLSTTNRVSLEVPVGHVLL